MATFDAYGVRFIGNDVVVPKTEQSDEPVQRHRFVRSNRRAHFSQVHARQEPVASAPQVQHYDTMNVYEAPAEAFSAQMPATRQRRNLKPDLKLNLDFALNLQRYFTRRTILVTLSAVVVFGAVLLAFPHMFGIWDAVSAETSKVSLGIKDKLHPAAQQNFTMPRNSVLLKNDILSSYVDAVESQSVTINVGTNAVTPLPTDIATWIKTSAGPEKGTTLLAVNEQNIVKYVANAVRNSDSQSNAQSVSVSAASVTEEANQIAKALLKYNGVTVTLPSSTLASQAE